MGSIIAIILIVIGVVLIIFGSFKIKRAGEQELSKNMNEQIECVIGIIAIILGIIVKVVSLII